jgi:hypothetical protein
MKTVKIKITGTSPILMHSDKLANPLDTSTKLLKTYTGKRKKTDDDYEEIARIEWFGGMYCDKTIGPFLPGRMIKAMLIRAATKTKDGPKVKAGLIINTDKSPLQYKGPRTPEKLWKKKEFIDMRVVGIGKNRVMRCRPIFHEWEIETEIVYDESVLDKVDILRFAETGGQMVGMGDYRPESSGDFGRFKAEEIK